MVSTELNSWSTVFIHHRLEIIKHAQETYAEDKMAAGHEMGVNEDKGKQTEVKH